MNYIVTRNKSFFENIGKYNYCSLDEMATKLPIGIAVDTETTGLSALDDKIFAVQFGTGEDNFLIDLQDYTTTLKFKEYEGKTQFLTEVLPLLEKRHLVFHNAMFDLSFLMKAGFVPDPDYIWDTLIASRILYNGRHEYRHDFGTVMKRELKLVYDKTEQKNIHKVKLSTAAAIQYSFNDVDKLKDLHKHLFEKLRAYGGHETYNLNRQVLVPLVYMELCGLPIDRYKWREKMNRDQMALTIAKQEVVDYIWEKLPQYRDGQMSLFDSSKKIRLLLSSPKQMIAAFKELGISTEIDDKKNGGKKDSIDESVLSLSKHEFVPIWLKFKEASHKINNFGQNILDQIREGRIYCRYNSAVDTSRIASRSGRKKGEAKTLNSLNIPSDGDTRKCFAANPGYEMVVADYSAQEGVILADLSGDAVMVASVVNGLDLHCAFARVLYPELTELSDEEITKKHKDKRTFAKAPRFALNYGGSAFTLHKTLGIPLKEAEDIEAKFKELHDGVFSWGAKMFEKAIKVGYIESADHWRLQLPYFSEFKELERKIDSMPKELRAQYKKGKAEYLAKWEVENQIKEAKKLISEVKKTTLKGRKGKDILTIKVPEPYVIQDEEAYEVYQEWRRPIRKYYQMRGEYQRLCLNNPVQSGGAHQIKRALVNLYKRIVKQGHLWQARLANSPYDEIVMEVLSPLVQEYKESLGSIMVEAGNHYLKSGLVTIKAEAASGSNWYEAK